MRTNLSRRSLLTGAAALAVLSRIGKTMASTNYIIGALRWDGWYQCPGCTQSTINGQIVSSYGPPEWQFRMPWFAQPTSTNTITVNGATQSTVDQEIAYAKAAGLNYWAYDWYGPNDALSTAWRLHQSSTHANDVNWCLDLQFSQLGGAAGMAAVQSAWVGYFQQTNYQKVLTNRPLLFLFIDNISFLTSAWGGSWANVASAFSSLNAAAIAAGVGQPYLVVMNSNPSATAGAAFYSSQIGGQAISNYFSPPAAGQPATYASQLTADATFWAAMATAGALITPTAQQVVPIVQTGWDTRAIIDRPPAFYGGVPFSGRSNYVQAGTPSQIASDFQAAINYVAANPSICPAKVILAYSWDECGEGGSTLIPTYNSGGPVHAILDAVGTVLNAN